MGQGVQDHHEEADYCKEFIVPQSYHKILGEMASLSLQVELGF
jgi:hypothetical protein